MAIDLIWAGSSRGPRSHAPRAGGPATADGDAGRAVVGSQRQQAGKSAALRTHMLVAMGGALFVLVPLEVGMAWSEVARVIQGLTAGIGFLGGGAILKCTRRMRFRADHGRRLWMTAAIGVATGLGRLGTLAGALLTWIVLRCPRSS